MILASRPPDEEIRSLVAEILSGEEFARWRQTESEAFERFLKWISEYLAWMDGISVGSPALFWGIVAGLAGLALLLLGHVVWSVRAALAVRGPARARPRPPERSRWLEEAEGLASDGRFLEATHRLALGSIDALVRRGVIELARSDANHILRERIRNASLPTVLAAEFLRLLDGFEQRWFRDRVEDRELYAAWRDLHARLIAMPGGGE